jgi:hypothetical protein
LIEHLRRDLERQPRLPRATHAAEREQARALEQPLHLGDLALAPDEARELDRQIVRHAFQ